MNVIKCGPDGCELLSVSQCDLAPKGWKCSGNKGHDGPCAAWPDTIWLKIKWAWILKSPSILFGRHL